ncbi:anhydro-N-acetylmuramic acid kinase AnmK [Mucilaginibacter dorajii]|uniref:Anhydro-N-acetylmuramic acid kinase AnmK n=2 Tax=Mucilaginibacter dorajii TaxID=692994 RepID=A0ABP7QZG3_9SPHI
MSGTSFDGLDVALCQFSGHGINTKVKVLHFVTKDYTTGFKEELKSVFAKRTTDLERITLLNAFIGFYYGELILQCLEEWNVSVGDVDAIASHGQTIFHAPRHLHGIENYGNATLQIGDADHLAVQTGIITLSDFRQKHIAAGGEGAPLALYGDYLIFSSPVENRIMLNIGGIANFTFLPVGYGSGCFSTDVGPGNTLMDQYIQLKFPGRYYDKNAEMSSAGTVNESLLTALLEHPFFAADFPKTTGPELFSMAYLQNAIKVSGQDGINDFDVMATLALFSAQGIIQAISKCIAGQGPYDIYLSGGGMYNPLLVKYIEDHFGCKLKSTTELGIDPDAKEAVLFAMLANEALAGGKTNYGNIKNLPSVSMGKISFPN